MLPASPQKRQFLEPVAIPELPPWDVSALSIHQTPAGMVQPGMVSSEEQAAALAEQLRNSQGGASRREALLALGQLRDVSRNSRGAAEACAEVSKLLLDGNESPQLRHEAYQVLGHLMNNEDPAILNNEFLDALVA